MAPFNLNSKYVELNAGKMMALRNYLVQKKIADEDLLRDETCNEILREAFARVAQIGPAAYNSLRGYVRDQGGVKKFLQLPVWRVSPSLAVATFNKRIQNVVPRESDFQQISAVQSRQIVHELFEVKEIDDEIVKKYRALSKLVTNAECEQHIPKRLQNQNKTEVIQYLREYVLEKVSQEEEEVKQEGRRPAEVVETRKKGQQEAESNGHYSPADFKSDMSELNEVMGKLVSGDNVDFLTYAKAVHNTFLRTYANLQRWERLLRQQAAGERNSADSDDTASVVSRYSQHEKKSHRRSMPNKSVRYWDGKPDL